MSIRFKCPNPTCKKALTVKDDLAGKKAACPACKKSLTIPRPQPAAQVPGPSAEDLEALAAAAFADEPAAPGKAAAAPEPAKDQQTIDFKCEYCDTPLQAPATEAGKKIQCTNPECRLLVKVPVPQVKKDWRSVAQAGPSFARQDEPEKLAGVQGSEVKKVSAEALEEAGVIQEDEEPVGWGQRIKMYVWILAGAAVIVLGIVGYNAYFSRTAQKRAFDNAIAYLQPKDGKPQLPPILVAELNRAAGEFYLQARDAKNAREYFLKARAALQNKADKTLAEIERNWLLLDLTLNQIDLGGEQNAVTEGTGLPWQDVANELRQTLGLLSGTETKAAAVRAVGWRLLQKKQDGIAVTLAGQMANNEPVPQLVAQKVAFQIAAKQEKEVKNGLASLKEKDEPERVTRLAHAGGHALEGKFEDAHKEVVRKGPAQDRLETALTVADIALLQGQDSAAKANLEEAFRAEEALRKGKPLSPGLQAQLGWLAAQAGMTEKAAALLTDKAGKAQAQFPVLQAKLKDLAKGGTAAEMKLADGTVNDKDTLAYALAVEAIARHNARLGRHGDVEDIIESLEPRFRPFA
ncbi:MAG TPA: hypothetical protein VEL76_00470, partial [Gemmataceae bacterium]|nr:hypothetical protein [Gemmataceae bacterium]